jgi:hypothetical protein
VNVAEDQIRRIQLRVCVVLQQWIRHQFTDFTDELLNQLESFLTTTVKQTWPKLHDQLQQELMKKVCSSSSSSE